MPVKIRLMRIGAKKRPFYRIVAVDEAKKRTGGYIELLGTYNPLTDPKEIILKTDRIDYWLKVGAVPSDGFLRITGKAPQRPPRKPKKEKPVKAAPVAPVETKAEVPQEDMSEATSNIEGAETQVTETAVGDPEESSSGSRASEPEVSEDAPETPKGQDPQGEDQSSEQPTEEVTPDSTEPENSDTPTEK